MSHQPPGRPPADTSPSEAPARAVLVVTDLAPMKARSERIVMVTVYDAPSARLAEEAGIDVLLVGDSAATTVLGHDTTLPVTLDEMLMLTRAARRGAPRALLVGDMPFGSYQPSDESAVGSAVRFVKEGGADAVKLEGAGPMLRRIEAIVDAGIPVIGHLGLTPQWVKALGGYKLQGRSADAARRIHDAAQTLERAGCVALVLEAVPAPLAAHITSSLTIPTIGIGAGPACDGQVLVWHDLLGMTPGRVPRFVKQYDRLHERTLEALKAYAGEVRSGAFPAAGNTYSMSDAELERFEAGLLDAAAGGTHRRRP